MWTACSEQQQLSFFLTKRYQCCCTNTKHLGSTATRHVEVLLTINLVSFHMGHSDLLCESEVSAVTSGAILSL